jgi:hypothetical protein
VVERRPEKAGVGSSILPLGIKNKSLHIKVGAFIFSNGKIPPTVEGSAYLPKPHFTVKP